MESRENQSGEYLPVLHSGDGQPISLDARTGETQNRDVGEIEPTDDGDIIINRTKTGLSPFVPIIKTPTYSEHSGTLSGYSVEIEDPEADTGYRCVGTVSPNYLLLTNEQVRELALEIADQSTIPFRETRIFWDGSRFLHVIDFEEGALEVTEGDAVGLSLITRSSYDKSWRFEMALMGKRFVCDNGMISGEFFARVGFKHVQRDDDDVPWDDVVRQGMAVVQEAPECLQRFVQGLRFLRAERMTDELLRTVWQLYPRLGNSIKGQIMSRYVEHEEPTLFGFLNAGTNVFWHRDRIKASDFTNNDIFSTQLLKYAQGLLN